MNYLREGFSARQSRDEQRELQVFRVWSDESQLPSDNLTRELEWEKGLSGFKRDQGCFDD